MKRLICLLLTALFVLAQGTALALGDDKDVIISGKAVCDTENHGVGWYDTQYPNEAFTHSSISTATAKTLNWGDWAAYDISDVATGTYELRVKSWYADTSLLVTVDGYSVLPVAEVKAATEAAAVTNTLGTVYFDGTQEIMKLRNVGVGATFVETITLKHISDDDIAEEYAITESVAFDSRNIIGDKGIGFGDNGLFGNTELDTEPNCLRLRGDEWAAYDVSSLEAGTYLLSTNRQQRLDITVDTELDGSKVIDNKSLVAKADYSGYEYQEIGLVTLSGNQKVLKITNTSGNTSDFKDFTLTKTDDKEDDKEDEKRENITVSGYNIYNDTWATGYYDFAVNTSVTPNQRYGPYVNGITVDGGTRVLHASGTNRDWAVYDISANSTTNEHVPSGKYNIILDVGSSGDNEANIYIDGVKVVDAEAFSNTGSYTTRKMIKLNTQVNVPEGAELLKYETGKASVFLMSVIFEYVGPYEGDTSDDGGEGAPDQKVDSLTIKPDKTISDENGVGFEKHWDFGTKIEKDGNSVVFRNTEWMMYDISALADGKYEVKIKYSVAHGNPTFSVTVGENTVYSEALPNTGGYGKNPRIESIGCISVDENIDSFKISNTHANAVYLEEIILTKVLPNEVKAISSNVKISDDGKLSRGADVIKIEMSNPVDNSSITDENVTLKDSRGNVISTEISAEEKNIVIKLKETLEFEETYTLSLSDATDIFGQILESDYIKSLKTYDNNVKEGSSSITVDTCELDGNNLKITGAIISSAGIGISGRKIDVSATNVEGKNESWTAESAVLSGEDGKFEITHTFVDGTDVSGKYEIVFAYEYGANDYEGNVVWIDSKTEEKVKEVFSDIENAIEAESVIKENAEVLGIDISELEKTLDLTQVYNSFVGKNYENTAEVIKDLNASITLEKINQASEAEDIKEIINNNQEMENVGEFQKDKWDALSSAEQSEVSEKIKSSDRSETVEAFLEKLNTEINKLLKGKYSLVNPEIKVTAFDANVGQAVQIKLETTKKQENVVKIHVDINYKDGEEKLFENNAVITVSKALKKLSVNKTEKEGTVSFDIAVNQNGEGNIKKTDVSGDICTISFIAEKGTEGTYNPEVSAYLTYHPESAQSSAYSVDVEADISGETDITVSKVTASGGSSGRPNAVTGGTHYDIGGGNNADSSNAGAVTESQNSGFEDLGNVSWAKEAIDALAKSGIVSGRSNTQYAPLDKITRAEFSKLLVLAFGEYDKNKIAQFKDVSESAWYSSYIACAYDAGFIKGISEDEFNPEAYITREDMAVMMWRVAKESGLSANTAESFADENELSDYAKEAVNALRALGISDGVGDNKYAPKENVNRAMAAKVIYELMKL